MSWVPLLATIVGAVIALGSGLLTDHLRSRRDRTDKWLTAPREAYVPYLSALHDANEAMRAVSLGDHSPDMTRESATRAAFRAAGVSQAREHILLIAPEPVVRAADKAFRALRARISQGQDLTEYEPALMTYSNHLQALRHAIRKDLQVQGPSPHIPL